MIVNAIGNPIQEAGTYSLGSTWGNVTITASGVTLRDTVIGGNLYISEGVDLGNVTLENVTVLGDIVVSGGGASEGGDDSIILRNVSAQRLVLDNMKNQLVSLRAEGDGRIPETLVRTNAYLIDRTGDSDGLARITLDGREENLSLTLAGNIKEVISAAPKATVNLAAGQAQTITVDETSTGSKLNIASGRHGADRQSGHRCRHHRQRRYCVAECQRRRQHRDHAAGPDYHPAGHYRQHQRGDHGYPGGGGVLRRSPGSAPDIPRLRTWRPPVPRHGLLPIKRAPSTGPSPL